MLSEDEASGYWGPGVFLNLGPDPTNTPHSITSRVAYWAGGIDSMEQGEPSIIPIKSLSELSTAVTKAACIQAMHKRGSHDVPLSATVDFAMLKPLIRGAPAILKSHSVAKRDEIKKDTEHNEGLGDNAQNAHKQVPTRADLMHSIVNYSREMGWDDAPAEKQNLKPRGGDHKLYILSMTSCDTGAQISLLTQQDAEKLGVRPRRQRVKITGVNGVSVQCQTAKVNLWLPGEKRMSSTRFAIKNHHENILGFDVLNGRTWRLPNGSVWSFGSNINPNPSRNREAAVRALHAAPALPESKITNVPQYPISAAARNGISEVIADLEKRQIISRTHSPYNSPVWPVRKPDGRWRLTVNYRRLNANTAPLTAAVPNIANLTATLQAAAHPWMAALDVKELKTYQSLGPVHPCDPIIAEWGFTEHATYCNLFQTGPDGPKRPLLFSSTAFKETEQRYSEWEKGLLSLVRAVKQVEKIHQGQPVQTRGPFNLLEAILKGTAPPEGVAQKPTVRKWYAYLTGVAENMQLSEGHTKVSKLQMPINTDPLALQQPFKPSPILDAPPLTEGTPTENIWFTDASAKRAVALDITTGKQVVEEGEGSAQVGEIRAVVLAAQNGAKIIYVDSYAVWAGATQWLCQWETLNWE
ncbi:hypothetical protein QYF61_007469, partial [Mycteria americana]